MRELAAGLVAAGLEPGARVALFAPDGPEWIASALAVVRAGAVVVPLDAQFTDDALAHTLIDSAARLVFTTADRAGRVARLAPAARIVLLDARGGTRQLARAARPSGAPARASGRRPRRPLLHLGHDGAAQGRSPESRQPDLSDQHARRHRARHRGRSRVPPPPAASRLSVRRGSAHSPGARVAPRLAACAHRSPDHPGADGSRGDGAGGSAASVQCLCSRPSRSSWPVADGVWRPPCGSAVDLSIWSRRRLGLRWGMRWFRAIRARIGPRLRLLTSGGAALEPAVARKLEGLGWDVASGYGLTETSPLLTLNLPGSGRLESAGRPIPGVAIRIASPADQAPHEGEIQVRGPGVFTEYLNLPDKTREAFTGDGWFRTGDLGYLDARGFLFITGRADEMLVTPGGENVNPENVEAAFLRHAFIRDFAVLQQDGRLVGLALPDVAMIERAGRTDVHQAVHDAVAEINPALPSYQRMSDVAVTRDPSAPDPPRQAPPARSPRPLCRCPGHERRASATRPDRGRGHGRSGSAAPGASIREGDLGVAVAALSHAPAHHGREPRLGSRCGLNGMARPHARDRAASGRRARRGRDCPRHDDPRSAPGGRRRTRR